MRLFHGSVLTRFTMEVVTGCVTALAGAVISYGALEFGIGWDDAGPQPGYFPFYIGLLIILGSLGVMAQAFTQHRHSTQIFLNSEQAGRIVSFAGPMVAFVVLCVLLGLYVAMTVYLFAVMTIQGRFKIPLAALVSIGTAVAFYVVMEIWFQVPLLKGPVEAMLGIY
jgi:hypothetical protein